jgi:hypothetical protein
VWEGLQQARTTKKALAALWEGNWGIIADLEKLIRAK